MFLSVGGKLEVPSVILKREQKGPHMSQVNLVFLAALILYVYWSFFCLLRPIFADVVDHSLQGLCSSSLGWMGLG